MSYTSPSRSQEAVALGSKNGLSLAVPTKGKNSIGSVVLDFNSPDLISGVAIEPLRVFADDRGFFTEVARLGKGLARAFNANAAEIQVSATLTYPGTVKAIHYHYYQTDIWAPLLGMFQVFLCDLRSDSSSFGKINTMYVGQYRPWTVRIPPGVAHGYKVLGTEPGMLVYLTDRFYNPQDEGRLPWDDPAIAYDWETQHK